MTVLFVDLDPLGESWELGFSFTAWASEFEF